MKMRYCKRCLQPDTRPGIIFDDEQISKDAEMYQLSLKDLCGLPVMGRLMDMGIDSFKIEGRMKSPEYVYFVTSLYRKYMDRHETGKETVIDDTHAA